MTNLEHGEFADLERGEFAHLEHGEFDHLEFVTLLGKPHNSNVTSNPVPITSSA
jgi:hypothetical protein